MEMFILVLLITLALLVPAKYDPAIRLKEWTKRKTTDG